MTSSPFDLLRETLKPGDLIEIYHDAYDGGWVRELAGKTKLGIVLGFSDATIDFIMFLDSNKHDPEWFISKTDINCKVATIRKIS